MGDFYDLAVRRQRQIVALTAQLADLRARIDVLDEALNDRDCTIMDLRDVIADCERRIDLYGDRGDGTVGTRRRDGSEMAGTQWARIDAGYLRNPKVRRVGRDGALLHLASILYLADHRQDTGLLPPEALEFVFTEAWIRRPDPVVSSLVKHGLWHPSMDGGFVIHDYDTTNGDASEAAAARDRQRRWRERQNGSNA